MKSSHKCHTRPAGAGGRLRLAVDGLLGDDEGPLDAVGPRDRGAGLDARLGAVAPIDDGGMGVEPARISERTLQGDDLSRIGLSRGDARDADGRAGRVRCSPG